MTTQPMRAMRRPLDIKSLADRASMAPVAGGNARGLMCDVFFLGAQRKDRVENFRVRAELAIAPTFFGRIVQPLPAGAARMTQGTTPAELWRVPMPTLSRSTPARVAIARSIRPEAG